VTAPDRLAELLAEKTLLRTQARLSLRGSKASSYVALLLGLLARSRLNRSFPTRRPLETLFRFLAPVGNHFLYDTMEIGARTGLPTERMVTQVQADAGVAERVVRDEEARDPTIAGHSTAASTPEHDLYQRRYRYHRELREATLAPSFELRSRLRRVEPDGAIYLTCVLDRFDMSEELFVRYTADLRYRATGRPRLRIQNDHVILEETFENELARSALHDSELAFILLSAIPGVELETVNRSRIGPLYASGLSGPPDLQTVLDEHPGELLLSFPTDRSSVDIAEDFGSDPLSIGYREFLSGASRAMVETRRRELGYATERRRKFVCTPKLLDPLRKWLSERDTTCVIYSAT